MKNLWGRKTYFYVISLRIFLLCILQFKIQYCTIFLSFDIGNGRYFFLVLKKKSEIDICQIDVIFLQKRKIMVANSYKPKIEKYTFYMNFLQGMIGV
ncbi:hypothetical protein D2V08_01100 [Flagellimonas lutimaris]|uniref:Uncharacterized protein n=1 Tax=Flagellimonas lutimaris TaxID=475082 RepID=A0A3A1NB04_9FLAO|nr:hypothetical protein D2V08_01100 [Allomuricauda lutimaris]